MKTLTDQIITRKLPNRILLTDSVRLADPRESIRALPAGSGVILRHYDVPNRADLAREILSICRPKKIPLLIAGDAYLAKAIGANGLHLPEEMLAKENGHWRKYISPKTFLCVAAHSPKALCKAAEASATFALLSPIFPTKSHPNSKAIGINRFASWVTKSQIPVYALGGVNHQNENRVLATRAVGWAAVGAFSKKTRLTINNKL
mgnify:CR=1 FL=1